MNKLFILCAVFFCSQLNAMDVEILVNDANGLTHNAGGLSTRVSCNKHKRDENKTEISIATMTKGDVFVFQQVGGINLFTVKYVPQNSKGPVDIFDEERWSIEQTYNPDCDARCWEVVITPKNLSKSNSSDDHAVGNK